MSTTPAGHPPPYVCKDCGHPRYALCTLRRMSPEQRPCIECGGRLIRPEAADRAEAIE